MRSNLACLALCLPLLAAAQSSTVYRCGADGRSYSDQACNNGRSVVVADTRNAEALAGGQQAVERERALNKLLVAERKEREREAAARGSGLSGIGPAKRPASQAAPAGQQAARDDATKKPKRQKKAPRHSA